MTSSRDAALVTTGRVFRGFLATVTLGTMALSALIGLTWSCCSTPSLSEKLASPMVWGAFASMPVAIAAFPAVAKRLRPLAARWVLAPFVLASFYFCVMVTNQVRTDASAGRVTSETWFLTAAVLLPTVVCAVYVIVRVLFRFGERR